jgi:hypothetical protein
MSQPLGTMRQLAYVVKDLDAAIKYWVDVIHAGPFFMFENFTPDDQKYRGNPSNVDLTLALGNTGDVQIELILQSSDEPSVYKEFLDAGRVGVHHFGMMPENYAAECAKYRDLGHEPAFEAKVGGADLIYFDTVDSVGHFIEFWDNSDVFKNLFLVIENAAKGWDGKDPIRQAPL